jgi:hypothetical protein
MSIFADYLDEIMEVFMDDFSVCGFDFENCLTNRRINPVPFMLAHMSAILKKGGTISFGGLITSIARALNLNAELATLEPLLHCIINLKFLKDMKLCKVRRAAGYNLMIHGVAIPSVVLPCS